MATGTRNTGEFCWINMLTPQPEQAREFFGQILGWSYFEMPGIGHGVQVSGRDVGGLFDLDGPKTPPGLTPHIGVMVKVENADAVCEKITCLGGTARPAFDILEQGRMAVCTDPNGAQFDVWEPKKMHGTDVHSTLHGAPCWFETLTTDVDRATEFYSRLFGWTPEVMPMPGYEYTMFHLGGAYAAGLMRITPVMGPVKPHWGVYFTVTNVDETAQQVVGLGAGLCVPPRDIPGVGRFCGITSPQRVTFYAIKYLP